MRNITVKYLNQDGRTGRYYYRRRVPKVLETVVPRREFIKVLGKTLSDAMMHYGTEHARIEHLIALAENGVTGLSPAEQALRLTAMLENWGADPHSSGQDENERTWREEAANKIIDPYQNRETGEYHGVPESDGEVAKALLDGIVQQAPVTTVTDSFKFYLAENTKSIPEQRKKQIQRYTRAEKNLIIVLGGDIPLAEVTKAHARAWRDMRADSGVTPATIKRERNDIATVFSLAISELDGSGNTNPFHRMKIKGEKGGDDDKRHPLEQTTIDGVYDSLRETPDLLAIWTLLDHTGARHSEIRMLLHSELILDHEVPHIVIQPRSDRTLKTGWSVRKIPLVGAALEVAQRLAKDGQGDMPLFRRYIGEGGLDRLSTALSKRIRVHSQNPKHVPYSLRHNMKDRMRQAEIFPETAKAIEGHAYSEGHDGSYGGQLPLRQMQAALQKALKEYRRGK